MKGEKKVMFLAISSKLFRSLKPLGVSGSSGARYLKLLKI